MLKKEPNNKKGKPISNSSRRIAVPDMLEERLREILRAQNVAETNEIQQDANSFLPPEKLQKSMTVLARTLKEYTEQVDEFYTRSKNHTGEGYKMIERVLKSFRDYKWIQKNRNFRFGPTPLGSDVSLEQIPIGKGRNHLVAHLLDDDGNPVKDLTLDEIKRELERRGSISSSHNSDQITATQADLYYMLCIADETDWSARALNSYINSYKPKLEVAIVLMIELLVEDMEAETSTSTIQKYGRLIRHVYMEEESAGKEKKQLASELGYSSLRTFYSHKDAAITFLAKFIFGISPGEYGLANIVLKDGRYVFQDLEDYKGKK